MHALILDHLQLSIALLNVSKPAHEILVLIAYAQITPPDKSA